MAKRKRRGKDVLPALKAHFGTDNLTDLARLAQMPRQTLANWEEDPETEVRGPSEKHLARIFGTPPPAPAAQPPTPTLDADLIRGLITEVRALREELARTRGTPSSGRRREAI